ncbi:MAG: DUF3857 domain-containing protein [Bacteroidales bacterium]|nr:DUF3857 domain-containing protein [Bacteroidales bacterium]
MRHSTFTIALACFLAACTQVFALNVNSKMGKPTQEELTMTEYAPDPEAEAVVLYSSTYLTYTTVANRLQLVVHYKRRIKILKEDGKDRGDVEVVIYDRSGGNRDVMTGLKGATFNLENGSTIKTKLNDDLKNEQRLDEYTVVKKFSMPNVRVGSIIEYEFDVKSNSLTGVDPWYAQTDIPVFYTEYETVVPEWFTFRSNLTPGSVHFEHKREPENYSALVGGSLLTASATREVFIARELPRIKNDDYIICINDFRANVTMDFTHYVIPGVVYEEYNKDWKHAIGDIMGSDYFGGLCKGNSPFPAKDIRAIVWPEDFSIKQKIDSLRNRLWANYSWDESYTRYGEKIRTLNKEKSGSNATLNFALMNMLNDAGIETYPVVLRSRSRGRLPMSPSAKYLNIMILASYNPDDSTYIYFDAGDKNYPVGVIPSNFLVNNAFLIQPEFKSFKTKSLREVCRGSEISSIKASIDANGLLTGKRSIAHRAMESAMFRADYKKETNEQDFIQKMVTRFDLDNIEDYNLQCLNSTDEKVTEDYTFTKQLDVEGDHLYINPFLCLNLSSPFKEETRDMPVEFRYNMLRKHTIELELPEGYEVEEMPQPLSLKMPDGKLSVRISCQQSGQKVYVNYNYSRSTLFYASADYEKLRNFFTLMEQAGNTNIVLKKKQ